MGERFGLADGERLANRSPAPAHQAPAEGGPEDQQQFAIVKDTTSKVFEVSVEAIDLTPQIIDVLQDLRLVEVKVGGQSDLPAPVDKRLGHPAEIAVSFKSSITITHQVIHNSPGVSWRDVQPAKERVGTRQGSDGDS